VYQETLQKVEKIIKDEIKSRNPEQWKTIEDATEDDVIELTDQT
jgi:hypothetical protein